MHGRAVLEVLQLGKGVVGEQRLGVLQEACKDLQPPRGHVLRDEPRVGANLKVQDFDLHAEKGRGRRVRGAASVWLARTQGAPPPTAAPFRRTSRVPPTAKMHVCGGLMTAVKLLTPNMPRLLMVNVPP